MKIAVFAFLMVVMLMLEEFQVRGDVQGSRRDGKGRGSRKRVEKGQGQMGEDGPRQWEHVGRRV